VAKLKHVPLPGALIPGAIIVGFLTAFLGAKLYLIDFLYNPNPNAPLVFDFVIGESSSSSSSS
jgi:hypothetical protein